MCSDKRNELKAFSEMALAVSKAVLPDYGHKFVPKTYTQPQLLACLLVNEYLKAQALLRGVVYNLYRVVMLKAYA
ncbi:MAG: hypothetical protein MN733_22755 [Nitrososphaera sp.]|nr:hypothetical protein [Nitrososphaera sp.]